MTEADWMAMPAGLHLPLEFLDESGLATDRKLSLLACACCRRAWDWLVDPRSRGVLECVERFADGRVGRAEVEEAAAGAWRVARELDARADAERDEETFHRLRSLADVALLAWEAAYVVRRAESGQPDRRFEAETPAEAVSGYMPDLADYAASLVDFARAVARRAGAAEAEADSVQASEEKAQWHLLHDLFGNPFRPAPSDASWRSPGVVALASEIYDRHTFGDLPMLARALQEAGCVQEEFLGHLRSAGMHARGCWALDLVLGKEQAGRCEIFRRSL
jgi:hypothetical protein